MRWNQSKEVKPCSLPFRLKEIQKQKEQKKMCLLITNEETNLKKTSITRGNTQIYEKEV